MDKCSPLSNAGPIKPVVSPQEKEKVGNTSVSEPSPQYEAPPQEDDVPSRGRSTLPFPWKLHEMLQEAAAEGYSNIVSWLPDCDAFRVHKPQAFVEKVMPRYFHQTRYTSFQRQLNIWGFRRLGNNGPRKGGYSNVNFVRKHPEFCHRMRRANQTRSKKTRQKRQDSTAKAKGETSLFPLNSYLSGSPTTVMNSSDLMQRDQDNTRMSFGMIMLQKNFQNASENMPTKHHSNGSYFLPSPKLSRRSTCSFYDLFDDETLSSVLPESFFKISTAHEGLSKIEAVIEKHPHHQAEEHFTAESAFSQASNSVSVCTNDGPPPVVKSPSPSDVMLHGKHYDNGENGFELYGPRYEESISSKLPTVVS